MADQILELLQIMDLAKQWPELQALHDEARAQLLDANKTAQAKIAERVAKKAKEEADARARAVAKAQLEAQAQSKPVPRPPEPPTTFTGTEPPPRVERREL